MRDVSRRKFLSVAGGLSAAAIGTSVLPQMAWAAMGNGPMGLPVGIQLYTVSEPLEKDPAGTLKALSKIGYREVETAGTAKVTAAEFRKMIDDAGLKCPSTHLQIGGDSPAEKLSEQLDEAHTLGAHYVVCSFLASSPSPGQPPKYGNIGLDGYKKLAARINGIGKKAKSAGLQYAYHNHNLEFEKMPDGTPGYDVLIRETDPELVKFEIDCGWMVVAGADPVAYFKKYPGRVKMLHIKDFKPMGKPDISLRGPERPMGMDLGTGFVQYRPIFAAGKSAGIEHIFVEQEAPFPVSRMDSAKADFAYIEKLK
jgi:sugar phosphate isomerase/epimerase